MKFAYAGRNRERQFVRGTVDAPSRRDAIIALKRDHGIATLASLKRKIEIPMYEKAKEQVTKAFFRVYNFRNRLRRLRLETNNEALQSFLEHIRVLSSGDRPGDGNPVIDIFVHEVPTRQEPQSEDVFRTKFKVPLEKKQKLSDPKLDWSLIKSDKRVARKSGNVKIPKKEIDIFTRRLAIMLDAGISISKALTILQDTPNKPLRRIVAEILDDLQGGNALSHALSGFPKQFDSVYIALVSIGESSGKLPDCLRDILRYQEQKNKLSKKLRSAAIYPAIILSLLLVMMVVGSVFFIPKFKQMFATYGMTLPTSTKVFFWVADRIAYIIGVPVVLVFLVGIMRRFSRGLDFVWRANRDKLLLRVPVVREQLMATYMYYFANTLGLILKNGIRMLDGIKLTAEVINNLILKSEINDAVDLVLKGASLSEALSSQRHFDPLICNIILTGEESGRLDAILQEISVFYRELLEQRTDMLVEMIQPVSVLLIAAIVVPVVLALFFPMLDLSSGKFLQTETDLPPQ